MTAPQLSASRDSWHNLHDEYGKIHTRILLVGRSVPIGVITPVLNATSLYSWFSPTGNGIAPDLATARQTLKEAVAEWREERRAEILKRRTKCSDGHGGGK